MALHLFCLWQLEREKLFKFLRKLPSGGARQVGVECEVMCMCLQALGMHESKQCTVVEAFYLGKQLLEKQTLWDNADLRAWRLASTCFSKALFFPVSMFSRMMSIAVLSSKQILASMRLWQFFSLDVCRTGVLVILHFFYFVQAYVKVALTTCDPFVLQPRARRRLRGFVFFL